ncbi:hypothetical protein [Micromonospora haikouensis]|uniref:hypothetical protein n=1 Tax=Micromonospora haikouensis TaxID=686309 RepID=UPI003D747804
MLHTTEQTTCPVLPDPTNYHFEGICEDCDVRTLAGLTLGRAEDRYQTGRLTQAEYEAYMHVWAVFSPHGGQPAWRTTPTDPDVRRIARKLVRAMNLNVPAALADPALAATPATAPTPGGAS